MIGEKPWDHFLCDPQMPNTRPRVPNNMPLFNMIKCPRETKLVVRGRYPPDEKTGERPRILIDKGGAKGSSMSELANSVILLGKHHESGLRAIAGMGETKNNPIEIDIVYTFTFERDDFKTTFPTGNSNQLMKDLMIEVQKDRCSGVFNFSSEQVQKLIKNEIYLQFSPTNETVKSKKLSYTLDIFNKMSVLEFSKSVRDTDINIVIDLVPVRVTADTHESYKIWG